VTTVAADTRSGPTSLRKDERTPPFRRVLVANRGEIALRIVRACHDVGTEAVAVYSDADAGAAHVRAADDAVRIGPAPAAESYLRSQAIIDAALGSGCEAVHPGYGFLAERAEFARLVEDAGLRWVGPSADTIAAVGDKLAARRLATKAGVPVVPGMVEPARIRPDALDDLVAVGREIGFPLLVKASAGGGGRGMRRVADPDELIRALSAGAAEAEAAFGDATVYLEREVRPARHVEVQLLGDASGTVVALGERDCSLQRRHQKLIEEAPAPGLDPEQRRELHEMAVRIGRAAGLVNAATAEFLLDPSGRFWFLEVNTRLQVEHGVTELVADVDIVVEQLYIAGGAELSPSLVAAAGMATEPTRHAIEVRLSAEDPSAAFAPAPARVGRWRMPAGPGVRVDTAVEAGDRIPPDYDPLIAKIMTVGSDRAAAIARMTRALDEVEITGIQTTLPFHRFVFRDATFVGAELSTDWVAEHWDGPGERGARRETARRAAAALIQSQEDTGGNRTVSLRKDSTGLTSASTWRATGRRMATDRRPR